MSDTRPAACSPGPGPDPSPAPAVLDAQALLAELAAIVGPAQVLTAPADTARYTQDWRRQFPGAALAVVRPGCTAEVARVVAACATHRVALVPQGGNTGLVGGSTPDASGREVLLSLSRMAAVRRADPLDNSLTLEAGCTVLAAQQAAAEVGRLFALSLASEGSATVGGVVATNAGGEQVLRYGNTRDLVLGLEVVLPDGQVLDTLGALRKDNTGYDLKQLFIGSEGTLGIVTAVTFKLFARPRQVVTAWAAVPEPQAAVALLASLGQALGERTTAFELIGREALDQVLNSGAAGLREPLPGCTAPAADGTPGHRPYPWAVLFDVSETSALIDPRPAVEAVLAEAVDAGLVLDVVLAESDAQAHALWALREHVPEAQRQHGPSVKHDISVAVSRTPAFIARAGAALQALVPGVRVVCFGHVGDGNLHYNQSKPLAMADADFLALEDQIHDLVHALAAEMDGSISAEHGIGRLKQAALRRHKPPLALALMARLKQAIDPAHTLNPGRLLPH